MIEESHSGIAVRAAAGLLPPGMGYILMRGSRLADASAVSVLVLITMRSSSGTTRTDK